MKPIITKQPSGMTLIEVMVCLVVIGFLASIIVPSLASARESARRVQCSAKLRELGRAATAYAAVHRQLPPGLDQKLFNSAPIYRGSSLFVHLLPLMDGSTLIESWDFADPLKNTEGERQSRTSQIFSTLLCPSDIIDTNPIFQQGWYYGLTSYGGNGGTRSFMPATAAVDGLFHTTGSASEPKANQRAVRLAEVTGGLANTIMFGERNHYDSGYEQFVQKGWAQEIKTCGWWGPSGGRRAVGHVTMSAVVPINYKITFNPATAADQSPPATDAASFQHYGDLRWSAWGSNHPGGANFCYADGSVSFLSESTPLDVLQKLATRKGD
jgi:prepilin-type N-terminal cleavage/methylation domain-containing protein/prepilin-type processing-associated H-X9-DG protein